MLENTHLLIINDDFWHGPKRVRHKMAQAWARAGNRVLWIEQPPFPNDFRAGRTTLRRSLLPSLEKVEERLWTGTLPPALPRMLKGGALGHGLLAMHRPWDLHRIRKYLGQAELRPDIVVLFQQPARWDLLRHLPFELSVYYVNDIYGYGGGREKEMEDEERCCREVDVVLTTARVMKERLAAHNPETYHIPHAVDPAWWEENKDRTPAEYDRIPAPRAVYTGVCSERVDYDLLSQTAQRCPHWQFVMIGPVQGTQAEVDRLAKQENVHFIGGCSTEDLPGYIAGADALIIPYKMAELQHYVGLPIKFFEYAISGKPILSTPFTEIELEQPEVIYLEENAEGWARRLEALRSEGEDPALAEKRVPLAQENTYAKRLEQQRAIFERVLEKR